MKTLACVAALLIAAAAARAGDVKKPVDSPLVKAAKASGGPKRKSTHKVITNADVKKSNGKLIVLPQTHAAPPSGEALDTRGPLEKQDDERRARDAANARVATAQKKVDALEKDLRRIEDAYYAENDPNYRDSTIEQRFEETKKRLDDARKNLSDAQDALQKVGKTSS